MTKRNAAAVNNLNDATGADDVHDAAIYNGNDAKGVINSTVVKVNDTTGDHNNSATVNFIAIGVFSSTTTVHNWNDAIYNNSPPRFSKSSTMRLVSTTATNKTSKTTTP